MNLVALVPLLVLIIGRQGGAADASAFYSVGYSDCLAVEEQHELRVGSARTGATWMMRKVPARTSRGSRTSRRCHRIIPRSFLPFLHPARSSSVAHRPHLARKSADDSWTAYERESGVEERVDTEPPELTYENWSRSDTEKTVAFVSRDGGQSWERLSTNVGFEGIHWVVQSLREGLPELYHRWLYTDH